MITKKKLKYKLLNFVIDLNKMYLWDKNRFYEIKYAKIRKFKNYTF